MTIFLIWFAISADRWTSHVTTMADMATCEAARAGIAYCIQAEK